MKSFVFVLSMVGLLSQSKAAQLIDLGQVLSKSVLPRKITNLDIDLRSILNMNSSEQFKQRSQTVENDINHVRYYQTYRGVQIWPQQLAAAVKAGRLHRLHGVLVKNLDQDIPSVKPKLNAEKALNIATKAFTSKRSTWTIENKKSDLRIYINPETTLGQLVYVVTFFADSAEGGHPTRPTQVIDANTGNVIESMENLQHIKATGAGGNFKTGKYEYGKEFSELDVTQTGDTCSMQTSKIKTIDLKGGMLATKAYSFPCYQNNEPITNGAYGPLNDAHYFAGVISNLYLNWYNTSPLKIPITMRVHYSKNYENAFWNGSSMTFGDGMTRFYPLVSLDVASHEIAHGFTEFNSDLVYKDQSGGMNEAFSDMAGEAADFYSQGKNDFEIGSDIFKAPGKALRYMDNPPKDGKSIDHVSKFVWTIPKTPTTPEKKGTDVHHSSGIFNKAFYLLATSKGWDTRKAFDVFVKANQNYWTPTSTFVAGAKGVLEAAEDLGYPTADVVAAFAPVGIAL
jgi:vibriolysin